MTGLLILGSILLFAVVIGLRVFFRIREIEKFNKKQQEFKNRYH